MVAHSLFCVLHLGKSWVVDLDPDNGACPRAAESRERHRPWSDRRGTSPQEIAAALRFILSAPAVTGQMIALDGGQHLGWAQSQRSPIIE